VAVLGPTAEDVRRRILDEIAGGALLPGERLGAERDMAERYGVSRSTLRAALEALESVGAVRRVPGRSGGTFVAERKVERDLTSLAGLPAYLRRQGFESGARVLSTTTGEADAEMAAALAIPLGSVVFEIVRIRLADGEPISYERARFPAARFPGLLDHPLGGSLYTLLESEYGLVAGEAEERIEIVGASATAARVLQVRRSSPVVSIARVTVDADGRPFELSHDLFRADRVRIVVRARATSGAASLVASSIQIVQPPLRGAS
jgi:GntR family transcriptional regulator